MQLSQTDFKDKAEARAHFRRVRAELSDGERTSFDKAICQKLIETVKADTVLLFYPVKGEPDILPFAKHLLKNGVRVAFPISVTDTCELDFRYVEKLEDMSVGAYGIHEPKSNSKKVLCTNECVCVVPALAFDERGMRIGYGKGYYDRFLATSHTYNVGVAYSVCTCRSLPTNKNDICVDTIITEKGVMRANEDRTK